MWARLPDRPADASWLTPEEAAVLTERAAVHTAPGHTTLRGNVRVAFARPFILALAIVYFANQVNSVAIQYNFPSIVESLDISGSFVVGLVSGSLGLGALAGVLFIPWLQRRMRDEVKVIMICTVATAAVAILYSVSSGAVLKIGLIVLAMFFLIGILPLYWSVAMARMSGLMAAAGLAFINTIGLLGGFVGPYLYGYVEDSDRRCLLGVHRLLAFSVLGVLLVPLLRRTVRAEDAAARRRTPCRGAVRQVARS